MNKHFLTICLSLLLFFISLHKIYPENTNSQKQLLHHSYEKILEYIHKNKARFRVEDLILLDYLQRRFSLPNEFSFSKTFQRLPTPHDIKSLETYGKLVNYKSVEWKKPKKAESFIWLELKALFIDKENDCPDKNTLINQIKKQAQEGGYATTHSALALGWFMEQNCLSKNDNEVQQLISEICRRLYSLGLLISYPSDLKVEAFAFICYLGKKQIISPNEIHPLFSFQRDDGAFSGTISPADGINVHTTLLMFWLALEFLNEDKYFNEPMIKKER